jgi:hypothetical protein
MYFEAKDGRRYPVSRILTIHPVKDNSVRVELTDGAAAEAYPHVIDDLNRCPVSTFAAQPETYIVSLNEEGDEERFWKTPVVGWCVAVDGKTYPITADGVNDGAMPHRLCILTPDGKVTEPDHCMWASVDAWIASQQPDQKAA